MGSFSTRARPSSGCSDGGPRSSWASTSWTTSTLTTWPASVWPSLAGSRTLNPPTEFRVRARDGSWHVLAAMSRVTQDEAGAVSLVVTSRDVTEQRALEDRLRHALRMESIAQLATA